MFEYPKWVDGTIVETAEDEDALRMDRGLPPREVWVPPSPDMPAGYVPQEYPKMIGDVVVNDEHEEHALLEAMTEPK